MRRNNPNKGEYLSASEKVEKQYWIEQDILYHETLSKMTHVVYHAKIRNDGSLSIAWSIDEVLLILGAFVLIIISVFISQGKVLLLVLALLVLLAAVFMLVVENLNMRHTYAKAKNRIYRVSDADIN